MVGGGELLRTPTIGEHPRQASHHRQQLLSTGESRRLECRMGEIAAADKRVGVHWGSSVRADQFRCAGCIGVVGSWQQECYHPDDDVGRAYRVGLARYLCLLQPATVRGGLPLPQMRGGRAGPR